MGTTSSSWVGAATVVGLFALFFVGLPIVRAVGSLSCGWDVFVTDAWGSMQVNALFWMVFGAGVVGLGGVWQLIREPDLRVPMMGAWVVGCLTVASGAAVALKHVADQPLACRTAFVPEHP